MPQAFSRLALSDELSRGLAGISISLLAYLHEHPEHELMQPVSDLCTKCGAQIEIRMKLFSGLCVCDECRAKAEKDRRWEVARRYWLGEGSTEGICPPMFRETDLEHPDFPKAIWNTLDRYDGAESLLLWGPSGSGKTRLAMLLLKKCLIDAHRFVGVVWAEDLQEVKFIRDRLDQIKEWGRFDLLLLDDALLNGAQDERITGFLLSLLDYRMRMKRATIITSQIGGDEYEEQAKKFSDLTAADRQRIAALMRRMKETFRVIPFVLVQPAAGEQTF